MKKLLSLTLLLLVFLCVTKVNAATYDEAMNQSKPCAVMVYANWADNLDSTMAVFDKLQKQFPNYNFVKMNIASQEAKSFNKTNYIYPNLPYVLLYKDRGRISRCISQDCANNESCLKDKMDLFAN